MALMTRLGAALGSPQSQRLAGKFGFLALLAIVFCVPFAVPAICDQVRVALGFRGDYYYYLLKPVENQGFFLQFSMVLVGVPYALWRAFAPPARMARSSLLWLALIFIILGLVSLIGTRSPEYTLRAFMLPLSFFAGFLLVQTVGVSMRQVERIFLVAVGGAGFVALYALAQSQGIEFLPYSKVVSESTMEEIAGKQKISSTFGHPNYYASYLAPLVFWSLFFAFISEIRTVRFTGIVAAVLIVGALVVSGARGPWLGVLAACLPYYVLLTLSPRYRRQLLFAGGMGVVLVLIILFIPLPFLKFQFNITQRLLASTEISARFYYWLIALEMLRDHPFFGVGYANFNVLFWDTVDLFQHKPGGDFFRFALSEHIRGVSPGFVHNDYLQIATETGVFAILTWLALWSALICQAWETARRSGRRPRVLLMSATYLASFTAMGVDGLFNFPLQIPVSGFFFWVMLGSWVVFRAQVDTTHQLVVVEPEEDNPMLEKFRDIPRVGPAKQPVRRRRKRR